ncbi:MAG: hypothetical protein DRI61_04945 [Chloroflexi bacterium]|nr:MAG: hypothetical protein DRI61_04945 [Chloroflexota bacterium]
MWGKRVLLLEKTVAVQDASLRGGKLISRQSSPNLRLGSKGGVRSLGVHPQILKWRQFYCHPRLIRPVIGGLLAFLIYFRTLAPGVLSYDFAEFQYLPARLGLPHPNGFPFYMLLGWLWSHLPFGSLAYRMNLLSALAGGLAIGVFAYLIGLLTRRATVGLVGCFFLALSPSFWFYALGAERYTLVMLLLLTAFTLAWKWGQTSEPRFAIAGAFCVGLGMATHPSVVLFVPFWFLLHLLTHPRAFLRPRTLLALGGAMLLPLLLYLYVPWRWLALAHYPLLPQLGRSEAVYRGLAFVWYRPEASFDVMREYIIGMKAYAFGFAQKGWEEIPSLWKEMPSLWLAEFPPALIPLALIGALWMLWRFPRYFSALTGFAALEAAMTLYIRQGKPEAYLLPAFGIFNLWLALSIQAFLEAWERARIRLVKGSSAAFSLFIPLLVGLFFLNFPRVDRSNFTDVEEWWREVLSYPLEEDAILMAHWGDLTPLWYFQQAEGIRPDLLGVFPPDEKATGALMSAGRTLYLAGPLHGWFPQISQHYELIPWGKLIRIGYPGQELRCPSSSPLREQPEGWPLKLEGWGISSPLKGGQDGHLMLCWEAKEELPRNLYAGLRLVSPRGITLIQKDVPLLVSWYPEEGIKTGQKGVAWLPFHLPVGTAPGEYKVVLTLFVLEEDGSWYPWPGAARFSPGSLTVEPSRPLIFRKEPGEVSFLLPPQAGPLRLRAFYASREPVRPGDPVRLELLWEAAEPPGIDYEIAFRFWDARGPGKAISPSPLVPGYPTAWWQKGEGVRSIHILKTPRGTGNRALWLEVTLLSPRGKESWKGLPGLFLGPFLVHDRKHTWKMPADVNKAEGKFGEVAELRGYALSISPGKSLLVTLYWKALKEVDISYTVFVHVLDENGNLVAQHDGPPAYGILPTDIWVPGEIIEDPHLVPLPENLPPGDYTILVGLYDRTTMRRLTLDTGEDALYLAQISIQP